MDQQIQQINMRPDFSRIYNDIIKRYPDKMKVCYSLLNKRDLSSIEIIQLNNLIFGDNDRETEGFNQRHRCYRKSDIVKILEEQKRMRLSNTQIANQYKISRNTIAKWKKVFIIRK